MTSQASAIDRSTVPQWSAAPSGPDAGPRFVLRREHFGALVYDRETLSYVPYDEEAAALLLGRADGPVDPRSADEAGFVAELEAEGLLAGGRLAARVVADRRQEGVLSAPLTVYLGATQGCNLACGHCQAGSGPGALGALSPGLMVRLFRELHDLGCGLVHVSGGEPLLHPGLLAATDEAFRLGLNVMVTTNGTLVTDALADGLAARPFRCVSVSIDGPDAATNDAIRGPGALERALDGLRRLARRRPTGVTTTLTPALVARLPDLVARCVEAGAASITLRPALPSGRARERTELLPSFDEFARSIAALDALQVDSKIPLFHPPPVPHQHTSALILERFGCVAGNLVCSVGPAGQVSPCALLGPEFDAGAFGERSLHDLWRTGGSFERLRAAQGNPLCWSCKHYDHCGGGCRARALFSGAGLDGPDPWCSWAPREDAPGP